MKLWQKVSLTALVFVMLAIQLTQFLVLERSFENSIQRERQTAVSAHEALSASLSNHAAYERLKAGKLLLSTDEIAELLSSTVTADISTASAIAVLLNGSPVTSAGAGLVDDGPGLLEALAPGDARDAGRRGLRARAFSARPPATAAERPYTDHASSGG